MEEIDNQEEVSKVDTPSNQPRMKSKHALAHDSIFKGKLDKDREESTPAPVSVEVVSNSRHFDELYNSDEMTRLQELEVIIHDILSESTDLDILANRRKPSKEDFNQYYELIVSRLDRIYYSKSEIFVTLSFYFSENLFNMMRLLDRRNLMPIIQELDEKFDFSSMQGLGIEDIDEIEIV